MDGDETVLQQAAVCKWVAKDVGGNTFLMSKKSNKGGSQLREFFERYVTKKDLVYVMIIIITLLIVSLLNGQLNSSEVVNVISIGAGLTSIFLALAAIVYSFIQSNETSRHSHSVQEALNKITEKVEEVVLIKQEFQSFREDNQQNNSQLVKQVEGLKDSLAPIFNLSNSTDRDDEIIKIIKEQEQLVNTKLKEIQENVYTLEGPIEEQVINYINYHVEMQRTFRILDVMYFLKKNKVSYSYHQLLRTLYKIESMKKIEKVENSQDLYRKIGHLERAVDFM